MKMKSRLAAFGMTAVIAVSGTAAGMATPAQAASYYLTKANFDSVCAWVNGGQYKAKLVANNTLGWRCYNIVYGNQTGVNVQFFCDIVYPGRVARWSNYNNPYDWRCEG